MFQTVSKKCIFEVLGKAKKIADVGIELEIEGSRLPAAVPHWQAKAEGSLQDGLEYITKPIKRDVVKAYVDNLHKFITEEARGKIVPSYRCSTHIHLNMLPEKVEDVLGFIVIWTMFEPLILSLCGPERNGNLFCMSSLDTGDIVPQFDNLCKTFHTYNTHGWQYERGKYSALNTGRLPDLGTLEARCFPLSTDGTQVAEWVSWLLEMLDLAKKESDKTYRGLWKTIRQNPMFFANAIFGHQQVSKTNYRDLIDIGTEQAYELTKVLKKYHNMTEEVKEEKQPLRRKKTIDPIADWGSVNVNQGYAAFVAQPPSGDF